MKCPPELNKILNAKFPDFSYLENQELLEERWKIIMDYYDTHPIDMKCQWGECKNQAKNTAMNLAGDIVYNYCDEHFALYKAHVKTFSILN